MSKILTSTDPASPIRQVELVDEDWAIVTVTSFEGKELRYSVPRKSFRERVRDARAERLKVAAAKTS